MNPTARQPDGGYEITIHELLHLPEDERHVLNWMQRQTPCTFSAIVTFLQQPEEQTSQLLETLQRKGFVKAIATTGSEPQYQVYLTSMRHQRHRKDSGLFDVLIDDD
jgi:predicted transcriptional regulator